MIENKENQIRENLTLKLNEFKGNEILIKFNEYLNNSLDDQINNIISCWTNEEFKEFINFLEKK